MVTAADEKHADAPVRRPGTEELWAVLEEVDDPEVPALSVVDLGIIRDVRPGEPVEIVVTPTYTGCPATEVINGLIRLAVEGRGFGTPKITMALAPAWTTDWMSEEGRRKLRAYGIAPPERASGSKKALLGLDARPACPHCGAEETERVSEFGSTACKALYRCLECREPFEYFKCI